MILVLAVAACAFSVFTASAFAKDVFHASISGKTKGIGEAGEMALGPYKFPDGCEKELKAKGEVLEGQSTTIAQTIKFGKCIAKRKLGGGIEEPVSVSFTLAMEFHANGFFETGEGHGVTINHTSVKFKGKKSYCEMTIPAQALPNAAEKNPEKEFEQVEYYTEKESTKGSPPQEKKYGPFRYRLGIEWELKGVNVNVKISPTCEYKNGEEGKYNPETGEVEFSGGKMEGELEEITLKKGNLSFGPEV
jgi:hypothetical protein